MQLWILSECKRILSIITLRFDKMDKNFETNKELLERLIHRTEDVEFATNNAQQGITVSFYKRLMSSAKAILSLTGDAYNGCILTSHMLEALIQLTWLLDKPERIKQYVDYGIVEQLEGLYLHLEKKGQILSIIKEKDIKRFLKKEFLDEIITDKILLDYKNYWYKPEANSLSAMVDKLTKDGKHQEINNLNHLYHRFCSYKHCSPYVMLPRYAKTIPVEELPDAFLAVTVAFQCLYICCLLVNEYQPSPINIKDITSDYEQVLGINWVQAE